ICPPYGHDAQLPLQLTGVREGAINKRLPGAAEATLPVQSSGGASEGWVFPIGQLLTDRWRTVIPSFFDKNGFSTLGVRVFWGKNISKYFL
ncbi:hypothetical protein, partial [Escherichia coli]|uniref:hypothetical protein n=1 Tax=Escherichia coli TaxID=562 RepID=UPI0035DEA0E7